MSTLWLLSCILLAFLKPADGTPCGVATETVCNGDPGELCAGVAWCIDVDDAGAGTDEHICVCSGHCVLASDGTGPPPEQTCVPGIGVAGQFYTGTKDTTASGLTCAAWDNVAGAGSGPHPSYDDVDQFPDASIAAASNHCRNPKNRKPNASPFYSCYILRFPGNPICYEYDPLGPWCFTTMPHPITGEYWDSCDISGPQDN